MRELNLDRVAAGTTKLHFIRAIWIIRGRSARTPAAKLETAVWAAMRSHEGRRVLAIAKKVTLKQNLAVGDAFLMHRRPLFQGFVMVDAR
jgi:hypothetical protein